MLSLLLTTTAVFAAGEVANGLSVTNPVSAATSNAPTILPDHMIIPPAPDLNATGYVLMDANSGQILAQKNMDQRMQPASLTKLMTLYIVANALKNGQIHLDDKVRISAKAWKTGGSKMFVKVGTFVTVQELIQGVIVDSGNDACTALAEYIAGTNDAFAQIMNQTAQYLGMTNTHYVDPTGLPAPEHYSTPHDMAILARAIINDFPEYYSWYDQKWFTYDGIRQPNRNRLLWRDPSVDGMKTGHTDEAGYCLVASAQRSGMRLIAVTMGSPSDEARNADDEALLNYGFRYFETHKLYNANTPVVTTRIWLGKESHLALGVLQDLYVTIPTNEYQNLKANTTISNPIKAPVSKGQALGKVDITLNGNLITSSPLVALNDDPKGGWWTRMWDHLALFFKKIF
ncbi:MAG: serine-type D-Ala-D-Ala carboxypeptidase [Gammaproteobacteria bacterium RIFOXYB2_FULL_38_6]|nr:MAG: serine-type D-Ala-D-Ala carboxypeptidase [Gammaproteobacteria bacterium RIFOXYB2_FULL_38_6]